MDGTYLDSQSYSKCTFPLDFAEPNYFHQIAIFALSVIATASGVSKFSARLFNSATELVVFKTTFYDSD